MEPTVCPIETMGAVIGAPVQVVQTVFGPSGHSRVIPGGGAQASTRAVLAEIGSLASGAANLSIVGRHYTVGSLPLTGGVKAENDGYALRVTSTPGALHVKVYDLAGAGHRVLANEVIRSGDLLLVRVAIGGEDRILALVAQDIRGGTISEVTERDQKSWLDEPMASLGGLRLHPAASSDLMTLPY